MENVNKLQSVGKGIEKRILYAGKQVPTFENGTKATFHFSTKRYLEESEEAVLVDDSRKFGKPMELIFGKQFKMPVWEVCLKSMAVNEVAVFTIIKSLVIQYPLVSKSYRHFAGIVSKEKGPMRPHCCGMRAIDGGMGFDDLNELFKKPQDLEFTFELLKVESPDEYEKEAWAMAPDEKLDSVPKLREAGNQLYTQKEFKLAASKYSEALGRIEQLLLREKPGEEEYNQLVSMKIPLLLNFSQCKLIEKDYYAVIEHTSNVLKEEPDNVKALFRRAKAHIGAWNPDDATVDFERVAEIDSTLKPAVLKEIRLLDQLRKEKDAEDMIKLQGKIF